MGWPADNSGSSSGTGLGASISNVRTVSASAAVLTNDSAILINSAGGSVTLTLPPASNVKGQRFTFKKISADANACMILGTVEGDPSGVAVMAQYEAVSVVSDGTAFFVLFRG